eukprot:CAMPEP_0173126324 /NCGR_PEP_ID=MMETSP1102-20130122/57032_1 /TAXON_ID=49646 /ORGANISM="Geminigera sp., Strain Caron Lab Isolate" /LENGTH=215 /DNA_ID=CAMNT_0014035537 /DNA_START=8 /DNA_END=652 /DNA_ORIENTATION=+
MSSFPLSRKAQGKQPQTTEKGLTTPVAKKPKIEQDSKQDGKLTGGKGKVQYAGKTWHMDQDKKSALLSCDGKISGMLLDLADRIPYNSVHESTSKVWDNFRISTLNCKNAEHLAQQLVWFSRQILPRVVRESWLVGAPGSSAELEVWRRECTKCMHEPDLMALMKNFECNAIDWDEVAVAFREEWQASKAKVKSSKNRKIQFSKAEELALAATTQ